MRYRIELFVKAGGLPPDQLAALVDDLVADFEVLADGNPDVSDWSIGFRRENCVIEFEIVVAATTSIDAYTSATASIGEALRRRRAFTIRPVAPVGRPQLKLDARGVTITPLEEPRGRKRGAGRTL